MNRIHCPVPVIVHHGKLILSAATNHPEIALRVGQPFLDETETLLEKVAADLFGQKTAKGELGPLTQGQILSLGVLQHCMTQARKTAKLAFPGQTVKLHQEFQIGRQTHFDLPSFLSRADIVLGSVKSATNLPGLKAEGWLDADTTKFQTARDNFGPADSYREKSKGGAKDTTTTKNMDAAMLYKRLLTVQNAADLQWPATDPANAGVRDEFRLGIFPPDHGGSSDTPQPAPSPAPAPQTPAK